VKKAFAPRSVSVILPVRATHRYFDFDGSVEGLRSGQCPPAAFLAPGTRACGLPAGVATDERA
jgi:hypothetical protein